MRISAAVFSRVRGTYLTVQCPIVILLREVLVFVALAHFHSKHHSF